MLKCIVTGLEHSGTTFLSQLLSLHPDILTGFECGLLMADSPAAFENVEPFFGWMQASLDEHGWGLSEDQVRRLLESDSWDEAYGILLKSTPAYTGSERFVLDKTPAYMARLAQVMARVDCPCVVTEKDLFTQYQSFRRRDMTVEEFAKRYRRYNTGFRDARLKYPDRIMVVQQRELAENPDVTAEAVCAFIDLPYDPATMSLSTLYERVEVIRTERRRLNAPGQYPVRPDYDARREHEDIRGSLSDEERGTLDRLQEWRDSDFAADHPVATDEKEGEPQPLRLLRRLIGGP